jgi:hypothetical protein
MRTLLLLLLAFLIYIAQSCVHPQAFAADSSPFLPPSLVSPITTPSWSFAVSSTNTQKPADWPGMDESRVFFRQLTHSQAGKDWTIKVGKGGQLYSIATPQNGELIPVQRSDLYGEWMDEVFQHTIPYHPLPPLSSLPVGDIHQAGYYMYNDLNRSQQILPHSVYSPRFNPLLPEFAQQENSLSFITWPQHAHLPRTFKENMLVMQENIRDMGDGVIEVTVIFNKWGGITTTPELLSLPWTAIRTANASTQIISKNNGSYEPQSYEFGTSPNILLRDKTTSGWVAFTKNNTPSSPGIGFVYGNQIFSDIEKANGYVRIGDYAKDQPTGGTIFTVKRAVKLSAGDSIFYRYYVILGPLADIQKYGNLLSEKVMLGKIETSETSARLLPICNDATKGLRRGCPEGETPVFSVYRDFIRGSLPVFLLQDTITGKYIVSSDPYYIDFDPTNGKTKYIDLLGWVMPNTLANKNLTYTPLTTLAVKTLFPATTKEDQSLMVRTASSPTPVSGDLNNDNHVNQSDFELVKSGIGTKYTIFDYNSLVTNFGK